MKKLYRLFFTAIIFSLSGQLVLAQQHALTQQQTRLTVKTSSQERAKSQLIFEGSPRVSQLIDEGLKLRPKTLQSAHQTSGVYWLGSGLFEQSRPDNALSTSLTQTLQQLTQLEQSAVKNENMPRALSIQSLTQFLNRSVFKPRVNVTIDPDLYLLGNAVNPQISGDLLLLLPTRPNHVWVTGNVVKTMKLPFQATQSAKDYLEQASILRYMGLDEVYVIQPNGHLEIHTVAYWNENSRGIAPGAIIYVPYFNLPSSQKGLNQVIPELLKHRVM